MARDYPDGSNPCFSEGTQSSSKAVTLNVSVSSWLAIPNSASLAPLRAMDVVAGEVHLPLFDAEPLAGMNLHHRVAEEDGLLHAHGIGAADLVLVGDRYPNGLPVGLAAPVAVEPLREFEAADKLLRRHQENSRADDLQRPRPELVLREDRQVRREFLRRRIHGQVLCRLQDLRPVLRRRGTELQRLVDRQHRFFDELVAECDGLRGLGGLLTDDVAPEVRIFLEVHPGLGGRYRDEQQQTEHTKYGY